MQGRTIVIYQTVFQSVWCLAVAREEQLLFIRLSLDCLVASSCKGGTIVIYQIVFRLFGASSCKGEQLLFVRLSLDCLVASSCTGGTIVIYQIVFRLYGASSCKGGAIVIYQIVFRLFGAGSCKGGWGGGRYLSLIFFSFLAWGVFKYYEAPPYLP